MCSMKSSLSADEGRGSQGTLRLSCGSDSGSLQASATQEWQVFENNPPKLKEITYYMLAEMTIECIFSDYYPKKIEQAKENEARNMAFRRGLVASAPCNLCTPGG